MFYLFVLVLKIESRMRFDDELNLTGVEEAGQIWMDGWIRWSVFFFIIGYNPFNVRPKLEFVLRYANKNRLICYYRGPKNPSQPDG